VSEIIYPRIAFKKMTKVKIIRHGFTELIHKTGSSGINGPRERGERIIAAISEQIWDYYTEK
jgi:hypothetical protein